MMQSQLRATLKAALPGVPVDWGWNGQGQAGLRLVLTLVSEVPNYTMDGPSGCVQNRVQIDVVAPDYAAAQAAVANVHDVLSGLRAGLILGAFRVGRRDNPPEVGGETLARISVDYMIHHNEE